MQHYQAAGFSREVSKFALLLHVGDPPQIECTMTGGYTSLPGLQGEDLIRLSRVTGPVKPRSLAARAGRQKSRLRLSQT